MKKLLIGIGALLVLCILAALILPFFFDLDSYKGRIIPAAEEALHRKVSLGHIKLTLLPGVGVELENVRISNPAGFSQEPFVSVAGLQVRVKLLPFLWGKTEIRKIIVRRPEILVEKNKAGAYNFSDLAGGKAAPSPQGGKKENPLKGFFLSSLVISDGRFMLKDEEGRSPLSLEDVNLKVSNFSLDTPIRASLSSKIKPGGGSIVFSGKIGPLGEAVDVMKAPMDISLKTEALNPSPVLAFLKRPPGPAFKLYTDVKAAGSLGKELSSEGSLEIKDISLPEKIPSVTVKEKLSMAPGTDTLRIESLSVSQDVLTLTAKGEVLHYSTEPRLNLSLASNEFSPVELAKAYPSLVKKIPSSVGFDGPGTLACTVVGPLDNLEIKGDVTLTKANITYADYFRKSPGVPLAVTLYAIKEKNTIRVNKLGLLLKDFSLDVTGRIENLSQPTVDLHAASSLLRPGGWQDILPFLAPYAIGGGLKVDMSAQGKPADPRISGKLTIEDMSARVPGLAQGVKGLFSSISFTPKSVNIENLSAQAGSSSLRLKGNIENPTAPDIRFDLYSSKANIDELFPPSEKKASEPPPAGEKTKKSAHKPPELLQKATASGAIKIDSGIVKKAQFRNLLATVQLKNGKLTMPSLTMDIYEGKVSGSLAASLLETEPPYDASLSTKGVEIEPLLKETSSWKDTVYGSLSSDFSVSGKGTDVTASSKDMAGKGTFSLSKGRISSLSLLEKLTTQAGMKDSKGAKAPETPFNDISGAFTLSDGKIHTSDMKLTSDDLNARMSGSFALDSSLDYKGVAVLSKPLSDRMGSGTLQSLVKDEQGRILLPFRLTGTMTSPKADLDRDELGKMAKDQAKKKVEEELTKTINKELGKPETKKKLEDLQKEGAKKLKELFK